MNEQLLLKHFGNWKLSFIFYIFNRTIIDESIAVLFFGFHFRCKHMFLVSCFEYKWFFDECKKKEKILDEANIVCTARWMALSGSKWLNLPNKVNLFPADRSKKSYNNETMNLSWCNSTYAFGLYWIYLFIHSFIYFITHWIVRLRIIHTQNALMRQNVICFFFLLIK